MEGRVLIFSEHWQSDLKHCLERRWLFLYFILILTDLLAILHFVEQMNYLSPSTKLPKNGDYASVEPHNLPKQTHDK